MKIKHALSIRAMAVCLPATTIVHYRYHQHKHVCYIEQTIRFENHRPVYWMRCVRCRDLLVWGDD